VKGDEPRAPFDFAGIWRTWWGNQKGAFQKMNVYSMMTTNTSSQRFWWA